MAIKKNGSGLLVHVIITVVGVGLAFFIGLKSAGSGPGDFESQLGELKSGLEANTKLGGANKKSVAESLRKVNTLAMTVAKEMSATRTEVVSSGKGMTYVNKILGLKWVTRYSDGHRYCLTPYPLPWQHAQDFAKKVGGSLVVIEDEAENEWIVEKFGSSTEFWIGLTDEVDEGKWLWVNDLDLVYKNWATGEPDNYRKMQHHVIMNKQAAKGAMQAGKWNDIIGNEVKIGIVEVGR